MVSLKPAPAQSPLIPVARAAEYLDVSPQTIRRRIKDGTLPAVRVGRLLKIDPADLTKVTSPYGGTVERDAR